MPTGAILSSDDGFEGSVGAGVDAEAFTGGGRVAAGGGGGAGVGAGGGDGSLGGGGAGVGVGAAGVGRLNVEAGLETLAG